MIGFAFGFVSGFAFGSCLVRVRVVSGSCLVLVWFVFGSCLVRIWFLSGFVCGFVSGFAFGFASGLVLGYVCFVSASGVVRVWVRVSLVFGLSGWCLVWVRNYS